MRVGAKGHITGSSATAPNSPTAQGAPFNRVQFIKTTSNTKNGFEKYKEIETIPLAAAIIY